MKHDKALAIRTLTEAMMNANSLNDRGLQALLRDQIFSALAPQAPVVDEALQEQAFVAAASGSINLSASDAELVLEAIGGNCPCCVIFEHLVKGKALPYTDETFLYEIGKNTDFKYLSQLMRAVVDKVEAYKDSLTAEQSAAFAKRFGEFTRASVRVRDRLSAEGLAPAAPEALKGLGDLLEQVLAARYGEVK